MCENFLGSSRHLPIPEPFPSPPGVYLADSQHQTRYCRQAISGTSLLDFLLDLLLDFLLDSLHGTGMPNHIKGL